MNIKEGLRRLGIVLGALGGVVGVMAGYTGAQDLWNHRAAHKKFQSLMASTTMLKVAKVENQPEAKPGPWDEYSTRRTAKLSDIDITDSQDERGGRYLLKAHPLLAGNHDGINSIHLDRARIVSSIELTTGEWVHKTEPPYIQSYFGVLLYPILGFLLPWGAVRVLIWVGIGFSSPLDR